MGRRDDVIAQAVALLRESGPDALTSVNVAYRLGVTQSAIYRHIRDMDELTTIASHTVVEQLTLVMADALIGPEAEWGDGSHLVKFSKRMVKLIAEHAQGLEIIDRWRYTESELGSGIRALIESGVDLITDQLESQWRIDFAWTEPLAPGARAAERCHAHLIVDDTIAGARLVRTTPADQHLEVARILSLRYYSGWGAHALDMAKRHGLPTPVLGDPTMLAPEFDHL